MSRTLFLPSAGLPVSALSQLPKQLFERQRVLATTGFLLLLMIVPSLVAMQVDQRTLLDVSVWQKPIKFQLSVGTYLLTLAWFMPYTREQFRTGVGSRLMIASLLLAAVFEVAYISWQAALGEASHFNVGDSFHALMYSLMGLGAVTLTLGSLLMGISVLRNQASALPAAFKLSVILGLLVTFILGTLAGGYISSQAGPLVGALTQSKAGGLPLLGWSREFGDLRVSHFFAIHALHILPIIGWLTRNQTPRLGKTLVWLSCMLLMALTVFTFVQAVNGKPFLPVIG